ncbi:lysosomal cholesterol signaling protein-like isoform X2 [Clytia hemisphaerica]|uniref:DEP domain-containing protein n=1 Tax=Clytia hemisphaerica TaxID=252671 RepID=A0A7M6DMB9_9CNID
MTTTYDISPTLVQCFGIILIGYLTGKFKMITPNQGKGLATFIGTFSLPALIFKAMIEVKFPLINWTFWTALLIAKAIVFLLVMIPSLFLEKDKPYAAAGLYSIFVSQSNDMAFGLPLLQAVFNDPQTKFLVNYVFLTAPISLAILNPIGFALLEYQKAKDYQIESGKKSSIGRIMWTTVKGVITNPLVFMIVFAIIFNFIFHSKLPPVIDGLFTSFSNAFGATALFYLGWKLGCCQPDDEKITGLSYALPVILVLLKSVFMPILMTFLTSFLTDGSINDSNSVQAGANATMKYKNATSYKTFAFLYGEIPTAPTVLLYANKYNFGEELVGSGLVLGTLFAAPMLFISIRMLQVNNMLNVNQFDVLIGKVAKDVSIISIVCCVYVLAVLFSLRAYRRKPHSLTMILIGFQFLLALSGAIFKDFIDVQSGSLRVLVFFVLFALFSCPLWCSMVAHRLSLIARKKDITARIHRYLLAASFCIPFVMALIVATVTPHTDLSDGTTYFYLFNCFKQHASIAALYTIINVFTLACILFAFICVKKMDLLRTVKTNNSYSPLLQKSYKYSTLQGEPLKEESYGDETSIERSMESMESIQINQKMSERSHITHHVVLLLIMSIVIALNISITVWSNLDKSLSNVQGLYLELRMASVVLTYGQGFFSFATFGFIKEFFMLGCFEKVYKQYLKLRGRKKITLECESELDIDILLLRKRFIKHHLLQCSKDIVRCLSFRLRKFEGVFTGTCLIDWLLEEGLITDRADGIKYGNMLLRGRVIEHCLQEHYFYDLPYFYQFTGRAFELYALQQETGSIEVALKDEN